MRSRVRFPFLVVPLFSFRSLLRFPWLLLLISFLDSCTKVLLLFFDRNLGGWACSFLSSWLPQGLGVFSWVFVPQGKLERRQCFRARQRVLDSDLEATFGHTSIATNDTVRPMRADAAPRHLHSSPGTEEESGRY